MTQQPLQIHAPILQVRDLCVSYGKIEAVHHANIEVGVGQIVSVIGPNGAGKTTMLSAIMGLLAATGEVALLGEPQASVRVEQRVRHGLSLVPESRELFTTMTVEDNLLMGAFQRYRKGERDHRQTMDQVFQRFPRMKEIGRAHV